MPENSAVSNTNLGKMLNKPQRNLKFRPDKRWILPEQYIGIEVELENVSGTSLVQFTQSPLYSLWKLHDDNSLRNNGREFVTSGSGFFGEDLSLAVDGFYEFSKNYPWEVSDRTGIHVHMDASDLDLVTTFRRFIITYLIMENPLFTFVGDDRRNNIFCLPWYKAQANLDTLGSLFDPTLTDSEFQKKLEKFNKYSALNLMPLQKFGTVEFRHLKTTLDKSKLISWINLIMAMKKFAKEDPIEPLSLIEAARINPRELAKIIFGEETLNKEFKDVTSWPYETQLGCATAQDVALLFSPSGGGASSDWDDTEYSLKEGLANRFHERKKREKPSRQRRSITEGM